MAFTTGTASGFNDLLDRLISFLTTDPGLVAANQQYTVLHDQTVTYPGQEPGGLNRRHVVFRHRGLSGLDQIYTAISTVANSSLDYYNWRIQGGTGFTANNLPASYGDLSSGMGLVNPSPEIHVMPMWDQPMPYWFVANGRRWWVVVKVSTQNESCGAGFVLPPSAPSKSPYPLALWGSMNQTNLRWSDVSNAHLGITTGTASMRLPTGAWALFQGLFSTGERRYQLLPTGQYINTLPSGTSSAFREAPSVRLANMRDSFGGGFPLKPVSLVRARNGTGPITGGVAPFGEADGLYWVPTFNNGAEDVIQVGGVNYVVFQTAQRSGSPYLFALRMQ